MIESTATRPNRESLEEGFKVKSQQMECQLQSLKGKIDELEVKLGRHSSMGEIELKPRSESERRRFKDSKVQELYEKAIKDA